MSNTHRVRLGESVSSIAFAQGFFWESLWDHPENAELRNLRQDPDVLSPGDLLYVPDRRLKFQTAATEKRHAFRRKGVPALLRLCIIHQAQDQEPIEEAVEANGEFSEPETEEGEWEVERNLPYTLYVDDVETAEGTTDGEGILEEVIPPDAQNGRLVLCPGTERQRELVLHFGCIHPVEELCGVCQRLSNLGYACPVDADSITQPVEQAIRAFQRANSLEETGRVDQATRDRLREVHGG